MKLHIIVKEILDSDITNIDKKRKIDELKESIEIADKIFSGEFTYCKLCKDYYLTKSFFIDSETVDENVCVYSDPINSGGDEYQRKRVKYTYKYCPKGCKHLISREELCNI